MSSYLKSIVGIMFFLKPLHDSTDKNILHWQSFKLFQDRKHLSQLCAPLRQRLKKNPVPWNEEHTKIVKTVKSRVKTLPCLALANPEAFKIVETNTLDIGYGGILKQKDGNQEKLVRYTLGAWNNAKLNYNTIKKEILSIVLCISKLQNDILNQEFLLRVDCKYAKSVLQKDVKNITSKHIFARWQAILSNFDFQIENIKGENNSIPDFLTREFLQDSQDHGPQKRKTTS